jgi:hypothetical protein
MPGPNSLLEKTQQLAERELSKAEARRKLVAAETVPMTPIPQFTQLPMWGEPVRGMPNDFARGALFTAVKDGPRKRFSAAHIATLESVDIRYTGDELRQDDLDVVLTLLHFARNQDLKDPIQTRVYAMLKELRWSCNTREKEHLFECFTRLRAHEIKIYRAQDSTLFAGGIIVKYQGKGTGAESDDSDLKIWLDPKIVALLGDDTYTHLNWEERKMLGGRATLAKWAHVFLSTHKAPYPMKVEKYHELSKSNAKQLWHFREQLESALNRLVAIGFLKTWRNRDDVIHVVRSNPTGIRIPKRKTERGGGLLEESTPA